MSRKMTFVLVSLLALLAVYPAAAHEGREVGEYLIEVGWRNEPAYVGQMNSPEVILSHHDGADMTGVAVDLQVEILFGPASRILSLSPLPDQPYHFVTDPIIPTLPGDYTFHLVGAIGDMPVDELFSSADGEFSSIEPATDLYFPEPPPDLTDLLNRIAALEAQVAELQNK